MTNTCCGFQRNVMDSFLVARCSQVKTTLSMLALNRKLASALLNSWFWKVSLNPTSAFTLICLIKYCLDSEIIVVSPFQFGLA